MQNNNHHTSIDVYALVTNRIIEHLEKGVIPWRQPWTDAGHPKNLVSQKNYRGINVWLLNSLHYSQNYFLSFKQINELGGKVRKGEKAHEVVFWKWLERENKNTKKTERIPLLRFYHVFNIAQTEGIPMENLPPKLERNNNPIETCEQIIANMPERPDIRYNEHRSYYHPTDDYINMPKMESFECSEKYYSVLFHELVHSTGAEKRLNRSEVTQNRGFRTKDYAIEELTAEMGASYLKSLAGITIEALENNVAYIQSWLKRLKEDRKFIIHASAKAQQASDYILGIEHEHKLSSSKYREDRKIILEADLNR